MVQPRLGLSSLDDLVGALKAAGEPTRLRVLRLLAENELTVTELTHILNQSQPRVSRHLKLLTDAGLVDRLPEGSWVFYRLRDQWSYESSNSGRPFDAVGIRPLAATLAALIPAEDPLIVGDLSRLKSVKQARAQSAAAYFKANAAQWDRLRALHLPEAQVESVMLEWIADSSVSELIDIGTGTGRILEIMSPHIKAGIGIDVSHEMLTVARDGLEQAGIENCHVRQADVFSLPFPDQCADLITIHQVLHYLSDPAVAVREAARLLRPGGRMIVVDFAPHSLDFLREEHAHRRLGFTDQDVSGWLKSGGLNSIYHKSLPPDAGAVGDKLTVNMWLGVRAGIPQAHANLKAAQ